MNGKEIAAQHKSERPDQGADIASLECFYEKISKDSR